MFAYEKDTDLCVIQNLKVYSDKSQDWRDEKKTQLLLSINKPHKPISVSTVSRWIKDVMSLSGIHISLLRVTQHVQHLLLEQGYPWQVFRKFLGKADGLMSPLGKNSEAFSIY